jgi:hypothetical protein
VFITVQIGTRPIHQSLALKLIHHPLIDTWVGSILIDRLAKIKRFIAAAATAYPDASEDRLRLKYSVFPSPTSAMQNAFCAYPQASILPGRTKGVVSASLFNMRAKEVLPEDSERPIARCG